MWIHHFSQNTSSERKSQGMGSMGARTGRRLWPLKPLEVVVFLVSQVIPELRLASWRPAKEIVD